MRDRGPGRCAPEQQGQGAGQDQAEGGAAAAYEQFDGLDADAELGGDLASAPAGAAQEQRLALTVGEAAGLLLEPGGFGLLACRLLGPGLVGWLESAVPSGLVLLLFAAVLVGQESMDDDVEVPGDALGVHSSAGGAAQQGFLHDVAGGVGGGAAGDGQGEQSALVGEQLVQSDRPYCMRRAESWDSPGLMGCLPGTTVVAPTARVTT